MLNHKVVSFLALLVFIFQPLHADIDWLSFNIDNDIFVGEDSGYTNGAFFSAYDVSPREEGQGKLPEAGLLLWPLKWSLSDSAPDATANTYTLGQVMNTPADLFLENPPEDDLPYSGLLFFNTTHLNINSRYADKLSTTIGIVGPSSGAEIMQKGIHEITGSREPKGWDTQLRDELVFQLARGRIWRTWVSDKGNWDFLLSVEGSIGTISSAVSSGAMLRYGRDLASSYASPLLGSSRTSNPAAINGGWYLYGGLITNYIFNIIFMDGNTFKDSRSIDYDRFQLGFSVGLAYSWQKISLTFAVNDSSIIEDSSDEQLEDLARYGTLTLAWRL